MRNSIPLITFISSLIIPFITLACIRLIIFQTDIVFSIELVRITITLVTKKVCRLLILFNWIFFLIRTI